MEISFENNERTTTDKLLIMSNRAEQGDGVVDFECVWFANKFN